MGKNEELQKKVQDAIHWEPLLSDAEVGVVSKDGIIALTGIVDSFEKKCQAESAAKTVRGVKAIIETIDVKFNTYSIRESDNDIAKEALNALKLNSEVPDERVKVKVENGWITLDGDLTWHFQKKSAEKAIRNIYSVIGVTNNIKIKSEILDSIEKKDVENAIARNSTINNQSINVNVFGTRVTLTGSVDSWYQRDEAGRIAWNTPGICTLENELKVEYEYELLDN